MKELIFTLKGYEDIKRKLLLYNMVTFIYNGKRRLFILKTFDKYPIVYISGEKNVFYSLRPVYSFSELLSECGLVLSDN
jgi:hypothetical protein